MSGSETYRADAIKYREKGGLEQGMDDATANSSTGAETFASQYAELRDSEEKTHLIHQQLSEPPVAI